MPEIEVLIMGQSYRLASEAGREEDLRQAVARVDREMCAIRDAGRLKARERIAVLAALNLAFDLLSRPQKAQSASSKNESAEALPLRSPLPSAPIGPLEQLAARERLQPHGESLVAAPSAPQPAPAKGVIPVLNRPLHWAAEGAERKAPASDEEALSALIERLDAALGTQPGLFDPH